MHLVLILGTISEDLTVLIYFPDIIFDFIIRNARESETLFIPAPLLPVKNGREIGQANGSRFLDHLFITDNRVHSPGLCFAYTAAR